MLDRYNIKNCEWIPLDFIELAPAGTQLYPIRVNPNSSLQFALPLKSLNLFVLSMAPMYMISHPSLETPPETFGSSSSSELSELEESDPNAAPIFW